MRAHSLAAVTIAFAVVACTDATKPVAPGPFAPSFEISDGAHNGNSLFYFLPPMMANSGHGKNVRGLAAEVDICAWENGACTGTPLAHFTTDLSSTTTTQPGNSETVRDGGDHYIVNWHTPAFDLEVGGTYRVCVSVDGQALGHADVAVVGNNKDLKTVNTDEYVGLLDDRTLPIKFRIEAGALDQAPDAGCGGPAPGTISGKVTGPNASDVANDYHVYLFAVDGDGNATGDIVASATTLGNGTYTFTTTSNGPVVADTPYLVCEANPWLRFTSANPLPIGGGKCNSAAFNKEDPGALPYAQFGYWVTAPKITDPGIVLPDFTNGFGT